MEYLLWRPARRLTRLLELHPSVLFKTLRRIHVLYFTIIGFPYYSPAFISAKIEKLQFAGGAHGSVPQDELAVYRTFSKRPLWAAALIAVLHCIFVGKNLIFIIHTSLLVDLGRPASNLEQVAAPAALISRGANHSLGAGQSSSRPLFTKFACLVTNCTQLAPDGRDRFASDLLRLPVFAICTRLMRAHLNPLYYTHLFGMVLTCSMTLFIFLLTSLVPLWCYLRPTQASFLLDAFCPRLARKRAHESILGQLEALLISHMNFCDNQAPFARSAARARGCARNRRRSELGPRVALDGARLATVSEYDDCEEARGASARCHLAAMGAIRLRQDDERHRACQRLGRFRATVAVHSGAHADSRVQARTANHCFGAFLEDCLPVNASDWFRVNWAQALMLAVALTYGSVVLGVGLSTLYTLLDYTWAQTYTGFTRQTRLDQCQFWRTGARDLKQEVGAGGGATSLAPLELDRLIKRWSVGELAEQLGFLLGVPAFILVMGSVHFYHALTLLRLTIADLKLQLATLIELTELLKCDTNLLTTFDSDCEFTALSLDCSPPDGAVSPMGKIRARLHEQIERVLIFWPERPLELVDKGAAGQLHSTIGRELEQRIAHQEFALKLVCDELRPRPGESNVNRHRARELLLGLLERLHISYRLFMNSFSVYHEPVTTCFILSLLLNYGFALIGLYWFKTLKEFVVLPSSLACVTMLVANGLVVLCSRVHAAGRKLELQFWSLVGLLTGVQDSRARHLRHLWVSQLWLIDSNGGLALRMFGTLNITYVAIIQSVLWTSSLLLFAYTRT